MTITEFLEARLDERERELRRLVESISKAAGVAFAVEGGTVEWSVERELADITAKRAVVALHRSNTEGDMCTMCTETGPEAQGWPCDTMHFLAQPYADHPDFDPAWRV